MLKGNFYSIKNSSTVSKFSRVKALPSGVSNVKYLAFNTPIFKFLEMFQISKNFATCYSAVS